MKANNIKGGNMKLGEYREQNRENFKNGKSKCSMCEDELYVYHTHDLCQIAGAMSLEAPTATETMCNIENCSVIVCVNPICDCRNTLLSEELKIKEKYGANY